MTYLCDELLTGFLFQKKEDIVLFYKKSIPLKILFIKVLAMSSYNNCIKFSLDIEDQNIIFKDCFYRFFDGRKQKIYQAVLLQPANYYSFI